MPENAPPEQVLTEREHAELASELICKADAAERAMDELSMTPTGRAQTQRHVEHFRAAAIAHALTAIALELTDRSSTMLAFGGREFPVDR